MAAAEELTCAEVVELVTDYLEHVLDSTTIKRFEEHLLECGGCTAYLDQMRTTVALTGRLRTDDLAPDVRLALIRAFGSW
jgi:predicted anti-sigma-YlaC factor YlaD